MCTESEKHSPLRTCLDSEWYIATVLTNDAVQIAGFMGAHDFDWDRNSMEPLNC